MMLSVGIFWQVEHIFYFKNSQAEKWSSELFEHQLLE